MFRNNNNSKNCSEKSLHEVKLQPGSYEYAWSPKYAVCVQPIPKVPNIAEEEEGRGWEGIKIGVYNSALPSVFPPLLQPTVHVYGNVLSLWPGECIGFPGNYVLGSAAASCSDCQQPPKSAHIVFPSHTSASPSVKCRQRHLPLL